MSPRQQFASDADNGLQRSRVVDNQDPQGAGRIEVTTSPGSNVRRRTTAWAVVAMPNGSTAVPDIDDTVILGFEDGDRDRPVVLGVIATAAGTQEPATATNELLDDSVEVTGDDQTLSLRMKDGRSVLVEADTLTVGDGHGTTITLDESGIHLTTSSGVTVDASTVTVEAGTLSVDAGMATFSGVVKADTLIANSVVASSYTPGAGNLW